MGLDRLEAAIDSEALNTTAPTPEPPRLICVLGAESTGKTTLARALAAHFDCPWVNEYLRQFCDQNGRTPKAHEQLTILRTQRQHEIAAQRKATRQAKRYVFCDTAPLLTAIYSDFVFGDAGLYGLARALHSNYALTLLLAPDIPWVADGLQRDGAQVRGPITDLITRDLADLKAPRAQIAGHGPQRLLAALNAIAATDSIGHPGTEIAALGPN